MIHVFMLNHTKSNICTEYHIMLHVNHFQTTSGGYWYLKQLKSFLGQLFLSHTYLFQDLVLTQASCEKTRMECVAFPNASILQRLLQT